MSAMPERVWLLWGPDEVEPGAWAVESREGFPCYVPESRLLAAEARVRELEQIHRDEMDLNDEMEAKLAVERDALVPLLRYFLAEFVDDGDEVPRHDCGFVRRPESGYCEFHDKWVQAQAILAREET